MEQTKIVITSYDQALDNALRYQDYLHSNDTLQRKLSQYTHWYYFPEQDIFAPSKFIGYKDNVYNSESAHSGDGRETEKALAKHFRKVKLVHDQMDYFIKEFYDKLSLLLLKYNKKPKANAVIHIPKEHKIG
jgi:hypothetical protein